MKEITMDEARKIIKNKEPIGLFWLIEEYQGSKMYLGIDNSRGKALSEAFYEKDDCFDWLKDDQKCRVCGCTWNHACPGGCYWVEDDLCSTCAEKLKNRNENNENDAEISCITCSLSKKNACDDCCRDWDEYDGD